MVIVPQEVSKPWPMAFGTLAGDIPDDARTSVSAREKVQGPTVFARSPPQPQPMVVGPYMSNFELFYYFIILLLVTITLLLVTGITATPLTPPALCRCARTP